MDKAIREYLSACGKKGGKKSVKKRFSGKTKEEISEIMKAVSKARKKD